MRALVTGAVYAIGAAILAKAGAAYWRDGATLEYDTAGVGEYATLAKAGAA